MIHDHDYLNLMNYLYDVVDYLLMMNLHLFDLNHFDLIDLNFDYLYRYLF